jgi:hypothetical protein
MHYKNRSQTKRNKKMAGGTDVRGRPFFWAPVPTDADQHMAVALYRNFVSSWSAKLAQSSLFANYSEAGYTDEEAGRAVTEVMTAQRAGQFTRIEQLYNLYHTFIEHWLNTACQLGPTPNNLIVFNAAVPRKPPPPLLGREPVQWYNMPTLQLKQTLEQVASAVAETRAYQLSAQRVLPHTHRKPAVCAWRISLTQTLQHMHSQAGLGQARPMLIVECLHPRYILYRPITDADWNPFEPLNAPL